MEGIHTQIAVKFISRTYSGMFRIINHRRIAVMVRARTSQKSPETGKSFLVARRGKDDAELRELINKNQRSLNVPNILHILDKASSTTFRGDVSAITGDIARLCRLTLSKDISSFGPVYLMRFINNCSSLGIADKDIIRKCVDRLQEFSTQPLSEEFIKCALAVWASSIWNGVPSKQVVEVLRPHVFDSLLENPPNDWMILARFSWCLSNDPSTRYDPSLKSRMEAIISQRIEPLTVVDLCNMLRSDSIEFTHVKRAIYERLVAELERSGEEILSVKGHEVAPRILEAWAEMRIVPPSSDIFRKVVNKCTRSGGSSADRVAHCLAVMDYPTMDPTWDPLVIKRLVLSVPDWKPTLNQVATLCGAFPVFGLTDLESASFIAGHLNRVLNSRSQTLTPVESKAIWQVGLWYAHLQHTASETTLAAINDAFRPLMTRIASNMWEKQGLFVKREDPNCIDPTERAIRTVVSESLSSLGISSLRNIHLVNTPFVAPLYLQDRNMGLFFAREGDHILTDCRPTGSLRVMKNVIESYSSHVRILNVSEYEQAFNQLSKDDFMEKILRDTQ